MFRLNLRTFAVGTIFLVFSISWGFFLSQESKKHLDSKMRTQLLKKAEDLAAAIDPELIKSLSFTLADRENKNFQLIRKHLIAFAKFINQRSIYSMVIRNGEIIFGPENLAENDSFASPPGTKYEKPPEILWQVFKEKKSATFGPYTDEYGTFVSAFAPAIDPNTGKLLLIVGFDTPADDWYNKLSTASYTPIFFSLIFILCAISSIFLIIRRESKSAGKSPWERHIEAALVLFSGLIITASVTFHSVETFVNETDEHFQHKLDLPSRLVQQQIIGSTSDVQPHNLVRQALLRSNSNMSDFNLALLNISDPEKLVPLRFWQRGHEIESNNFSNIAYNRIIPAFGKNSTFAIGFTPDQETTYSAWKINLLLPLCSGTIISFLLTYFVWFLRNNQINLELTVNKRTSELREREENLKVTLYSIGDAVIATDSEGLVTRMNLVAEQLTGWNSSDALNKPLDEVFKIVNSITREKRINPVKKVLETGNIVALANDTALISRDGREQQIADSAAPIKDSSGTIKGVILVFRDVTKEYLRQKKLQESEQQFRTIFNSVATGIVIIDSQTMKILSINRSGELMIGLNARDIIGKICHSFICPAERGNCPVKDKGQVVDHSERKLLTRDGSEKIIIKSVSPIIFEGNNCFLESFIDISAEKESQKQLETARKQAEEMAQKAKDANSAKSAFLAVMSHEIRTPMNGVIGMLGMLLDMPLSTTQFRYAETARSCCENLIRIINDILDFSKADAGKMELEALSFDLYSALEDTMDILSAKALSKNLELLSFIAPDIPSFLEGDPGRLRQVLMNFLSNAIKFTDKGSITLRASIDKLNQQTVVVRFSVTDTGIGIQESRVHELFSPFTQADSSTSRKYGGTGLGLAICKQLVGLMGGEVGVKSELNKGSEFWFTSVFKLPSITSEQASEIPVMPNNLKILIADSSSNVRLMLRTLLKNSNCSFCDAEDGKSALNMLIDANNASSSFDVAVIDANLPLLKGVELEKLIRSTPSISDTPLIIMTTLSDSNHSEFCIPKPIRRSFFFSILNQAAGKSALTELSKKEKSQYQKIPDEIKKRIRILIAEDNQVNQQIAVAQLKKLGYRADVVSNGLDAIESLKNISYDIVLMDCLMPEMNGFDATRMIRAKKTDSKKPHLPIIALTANNTKEDKEECLKAGMDDFLSKPFKNEHLKAMLEKWLSGIEKYSYESNVAENESKKELKAFNKDALLNRLMGDEHLTNEIIQTFVNTFPAQISELEKALNNDDTTSIEKLAQFLKGSSANAGAEQIQIILFGIEQLASLNAVEEVPQMINDLRSHFDSYKNEISKR
ncbi:MAG: response regulator [Candidatus Riflebacteria bacterium]|nr:response regulator [Candidatus Riflebacteria bacterium]